MRYLKRDIKLICFSVAFVVLVSFIIDTLLDYSLYHKNIALINNYKNMNEIDNAYTNSKAAFRMFNRTQNGEYLLRYLDFSQKTEKLLTDLSDFFNNDDKSILYYRIVLQMLEHRDESVRKFIVYESIQGTRLEDIEYIHILNDMIEEEIRVLISVNIDRMKSITDEHAMKNELYQLYASIFIFSLMLGLILLLYHIARNVLRTISGINYAAKELISNNFEVEDIKSTRYYEVNLFVSTFNNMKHSVKALIRDINRFAENKIENEQQMRLLSESKMKQLQMQINPHFLFNTLSLVIRSIQRNEMENSIQLIKATSRILRSSMDIKNPTITLDEEIELLKSCIFIHQLHLQNRVAFYLDIRKSYSDNEIQVPPLVMQPIVENSVFHGLKDVTEGGIVRINITEYTDYVEVIFEDNGIGMRQEQIDELFIGNNNRRIGLNNVLERLRICYKEDDVFQISSIPTKGTKVVMKLYKQKGTYECTRF